MIPSAHEARETYGPQAGCSATAVRSGRKTKPRTKPATKKVRLTREELEERLFNKAIEGISKVPADQWLWNR
jgi:hypothetical protein